MPEKSTEKSTEKTAEKTVHAFQAEVNQVLKLVVESLYSNKEVFLRELISNASDALDKLRFRALQNPEILGSEALKIQLSTDAEQGTLTVSDNGIGMTAEELAQNLGTIAWSGSKAFAEELMKAKEAAAAGRPLIGQFGVGFYSAYLVADRVDVVTRPAGSDQAFHWSSTGRDEFTIEPATRAEPGTSVIVHLKQDQREYLETFRLRELVRRYSDYISHPIELLVEKPAQDDKQARAFEVVNQGTALWQRVPKDVTPEQYKDFYKHLTHDWQEPLAWRHFQIEGTQLFSALLFIPKREPFDMFEPNPKHGVRLHVRRVFVMDDCEELVPRWLRFVRGVVDSEDLPLNVSREILQDSKTVNVMRRQIVQRTLDLLDELVREKPESYAEFWRHFGAVLKEGLHFEPEYKERLAKLVRYASSTEELTSLDAYIERMKEGQPGIYYATGLSRRSIEAGPHIEALRDRGFEVLYLVDPVDPFAVAALPEYRDKPLLSALSADLKLPELEKRASDQSPELETPTLLLERFQTVLKDRVSAVRASTRLKDSPVCLVVPEGGLAPHVERLLRLRNADLPQSKRILEVNTEHPLNVAMNKLLRDAANAEKIDGWIELLHDQALLAEGSPIEDPASFVRRVSELLTVAARAAG